ncbi:hypothetical protein FHS95_000208 [Sphingomonas naasensis]|uniref:Uncharacterized protein n=1 Tax=Sphingomonas naasensis TaxID=1344951 RepID=A0A4S1WUB4_9SPHN|nr:hypothetical protein [Sphingomonas naasensis]NIJ18539.1 hypothetical protein [Sphingomonas naasensis]TGX45790.1 hypothetical protein E5A74_01005 [Sphingomonas naasensis]
MAGRALSDADRFLMEAVDSVPDSADRRVDLSALADEDGFAHADASAKAWEQAGYGRCERNGTQLVFAFSAKGYAAAQTESERLFALHQASRRWKLPTLDMASGWVGGAIFVVAALYSLMMFFWG